MKPPPHSSATGLPMLGSDRACCWGVTPIAADLRELTGGAEVASLWQVGVLLWRANPTCQFSEPRHQQCRSDQQRSLQIQFASIRASPVTGAYMTLDQHRRARQEGLIRTGARLRDLDVREMKAGDLSGRDARVYPPRLSGILGGRRWERSPKCTCSHHSLHWLIVKSFYKVQYYGVIFNTLLAGC